MNSLSWPRFRSSLRIVHFCALVNLLLNVHHHFDLLPLPVHTASAHSHQERTRQHHTLLLLLLHPPLTIKFPRTANPHITQKHRRNNAERHKRHHRNEAPHDGPRSRIANRILRRRRQVGKRIEIRRPGGPAIERGGISGVDGRQVLRELIAEDGAHHRDAQRLAERKREAEHALHGRHARGPDPRCVEDDGHEAECGAGARNGEEEAHESGVARVDGPGHGCEADGFDDGADEERVEGLLGPVVAHGEGEVDADAEARCVEEELGAGFGGRVALGELPVVRDEVER